MKIRTKHITFNFPDPILYAVIKLPNGEMKLNPIAYPEKHAVIFDPLNPGKFKKIEVGDYYLDGVVTFTGTIDQCHVQMSTPINN